MISVENIETCGWEAAIRGMRNPMNSWDKSDSKFHCDDYNKCDKSCEYYDVGCKPIGAIYIGKNDLSLMKRLFKGGSEHRKYLRMINVTLDITAPLYWWKEFDTYKVGTVCNSCSTMHKIHAKEFELDDFSHEHLVGMSLEVLELVIKELNARRVEYNWCNTDSKKRYWWQMIQLLPSSYNQRRTIQMNYETVVNIIKQRENHKLDEWREFVDTLKSLPYVEELLSD